jgi:hypothetical protein
LPCTKMLSHCRPFIDFVLHNFCNCQIVEHAQKYA